MIVQALPFIIPILVILINPLLFIPLVHGVGDDHAPQYTKVVHSKFPTIITTQFNTTIFSMLMSRRKDNSASLQVGGLNQLLELNPTNLEMTKSRNQTVFSDCNPKNQIVDQEFRYMFQINGKPFDHIMACGPANYGSCHIINEDRSGLLKCHPMNMLVSGKNSVIVPKYSEQKGETHLYIGTEYDKRPVDLFPPVISARHFDIKSIEFSYLSSDKSDEKSYINLTQSIKETYDIHFVDGFTLNSYIYFLSVQPMNSKSPEHHTRLGRICAEDPSLTSYTEIPLSATFKDGEDDDEYWLAQAMTLGKQSGEDVLIVAFMAAKSKKGPEVDMESGSVVSIYTISELDIGFEEAINTCYSGNRGDNVKATSRLSPVFHRNEAQTECKQNLREKLRNVCGPNKVNPYIEGEGTIRKEAILHIDRERVTAITSISVANYDQPILFLGTQSGLAIKATPNNILFENRLSTVDLKADKREIKQQLVKDETSSNVYFMADNQLTKFPMKSCSIYTECETCLSSQDPLGCGWCGETCGHAGECGGKKPNKTACFPVIYNFRPMKGPLDGGTELRIVGTNFGTSQSGTPATAWVGDTVCRIKMHQNDMIICETGKMNGLKDAFVTVKVSDSRGTYPTEGTVKSKEMFQYVTPSISHVDKSFGPYSGPVKLIIKGESLDTGSKQVVKIGNATTCTVDTVNSTVMTCKMVPLAEVLKANNLKHDISVQFDQLTITTPYKFEFKENPVIRSIFPEAITVFGGSDIFVIGENFMSITGPWVLNLQYEDSVNMHIKCIVMNDTYLECKSQKIFADIKGNHHLKASVKFYVDDELFPRSGDQTLSIFPEPVIYNFVDPPQEVDISDGLVTIVGTGLSSLYNPKITISSDNLTCIIQTSEFSKLTCKIKYGAIKPAMGNVLQVHWKSGLQEIEAGNIKFVHKEVTGLGTFTYLIIGALVFLFIFSMGFFIWRKFDRKEKDDLTLPRVRYTANGQPASHANDYGTQNRSDFNDSNFPLISNRPVLNEETIAMLTENNKLIPRVYLTICQKDGRYWSIGKGNFGEVFRGRLYDRETDKNIDVAIKTIKKPEMMKNEPVSGEWFDIDLFINEALIMKDLDHENVMKLLGLCVDENQSPMVVLPFMAKGDLRSYLQNPSSEVLVVQLIQFAVEIAQGMEYLSFNHLVHRDLAARNCMIDENLQIRVADFGLSRDVYTKEYYVAGGKGGLPVKWMAPESLENRTYTVKSDVWSFGIVCWELMTRGVEPYPSIGNWDVVDYLKAGHRLLCPIHCPEVLYNIMQRCWLTNPSERPTFTQLVDELGTVITNGSHPKTPVQHGATYVNYPKTYYNHSQEEMASPIPRLSIGGTQRASTSQSTTLGFQPPPHPPSFVTRNNMPDDED